MHVSCITTALTLALLATPTFACLPGLQRRQLSNQTTQVETRVAPRPPKTKTALVNVRVFDGYTVQNASTVFFDGDTITDDPTRVDSVVDGAGGILLPGLIDSHCHPNTMQDLEDLSSYGVTSAMSMSCQNYQQCSALHDQVGLTSYFTAGHAAIGPNSSHANMQHLPPDRLIYSASQAPDWVTYVFGNGSDYLKITSEENGPDQDTQNALVTYTHALGRKSMTHAAEFEYYRMAIASKTDGPQHMPYDQLLDDDMINQMVAQKQFATPTMYLYKNMLKNINVLIPDAPPINFTQAYGTVQQNVRNLHSHGVPVLAGTDASTSLYKVSLPMGTSLHDELVNFVEIGFTPAEAIRAATLIPAISHDLGNRGVIAPGMRADLLLLQPGADPMRNISDTRKISRVWNGGIPYASVASSS